MMRTLFSVFIGYAVLAAATMAMTFGLMACFPEYRDAGLNQRPVGGLPVFINLMLGLPGAALGGMAAAKIAKPPKLRAAVILAGAVLALGLGYAVFQVSDTPTGQPTLQPLWYLWSLPVVGSLGVLFGGWLCVRPAPRSVAR